MALLYWFANCFVVLWFVRNLTEGISGRYERLVIQTDIDIISSNYWDGYGKDNWQPKIEVKTNFGAGYFILEYIDF